MPIVGCATEGTVSVSTVMLRRGGSARDLFESDEREGFEDTVGGRCVDAARFSCIFPFLPDLVALSLPLSLFLLLLSLVLRSSVTLDELTSLRSSSGARCPDALGAKLCGSRPSKPGVAGRLDSWTVSSLGAAPLAPRDGPLALITGSSGSLADASSLTGNRASEAGEELCTTMAGVDCASGFLMWARSELARERERPSSPGGGERRRGEMGQ